MLYTLFATNPYYNLELLYTKDLDEAMKAGAMFGKVQENLVVWNDRYFGEPQAEKMEHIELYSYGENGQTLMGRFDKQGDFIEAGEEEE